MKAKIKTGFGPLSVNSFILSVRYILSMLAGNTNFPNLPFTTPEVEADVDTLAQLQSQVRLGNRINIGARDQQKDIVHQKMTANAAYVNSVGLGNPSMLLTSGFELIKSPVPHTVPTEIAKISAKALQPVGKVKVNWSASKERDYYVLEKRVGDTGTWEEVDIVTKTNYIVTGLTYKDEVHFRVAAVNSVGTSPWSDVAKVVVA